MRRFITPKNHQILRPVARYFHELARISELPVDVVNKGEVFKFPGNNHLGLILPSTLVTDDCRKLVRETILEPSYREAGCNIDDEESFKNLLFCMSKLSRVAIFGEGSLDCKEGLAAKNSKLITANTINLVNYMNMRLSQNGYNERLYLNDQNFRSLTSESQLVLKSIILRDENLFDVTLSEIIEEKLGDCRSGSIIQSLATLLLLRELGVSDDFEVGRGGYVTSWNGRDNSDHSIAFLNRRKNDHSEEARGELILDHILMDPTRVFSIFNGGNLKVESGSLTIQRGNYMSVCIKPVKYDLCLEKLDKGNGNGVYNKR